MDSHLDLCWIEPLGLRARLKHKLGDLAISAPGGIDVSIRSDIDLYTAPISTSERAYPASSSRPKFWQESRPC